MLSAARKKLLMTITCLVLVYMSWGSCYISVKFALESFPPFLLCGIRMSSAGAILYLATWLYGERSRPTLADFRQSLILSFFMVLISSGFLCKGQESVPSGIAGMFSGMVPIWMVIGGWLFLHEARPRKLQYVGLAGGTFGIILLSLNQGISGLTSWWGPLFLLLGTLGWVVGSFYSKVHAGETKLSVMRVSALLMFIGGLQALIAAFLLGESVSLAEVTPKSWTALTALVLFSGIVAYCSYFWLLMNTRTEVAISFEYVNPVIGVFLGWLLGNEHVGLIVLTACPCIVGSVFFVVAGPRD